MEKIVICFFCFSLFVYSKTLMAISVGVMMLSALAAIGFDHNLSQYAAYSVPRGVVAGIIHSGSEAVVAGAEKVLKLVQESVVENTYNMYEAFVMQAQIDSKGLSSDCSDPWVGGGKPSVAITVEEQRFDSQTGEKIVEDKSWSGWGAGILRRVMCGAMTDENRTNERLTYQVVEVDNGNNPEEIEGGGSYDVLPPAAVTVDRRRVEIRSPVLPIFSSFALF